MSIFIMLSPELFANIPYHIRHIPQDTAHFPCFHENQCIRHGTLYDKHFLPYPELQFSGFERYDYKSKGSAGAIASCYWQVGACAGVCLFPVIFFGNYPLVDFLNAVTGWGAGMDEVLETGARIQTLRQCFNIREGIKPEAVKLPPRLAGIPPQKDGPLAGVTIDIESLAREYDKAMGWDPATRVPSSATLERLRLGDLVEGRRGEAR